MIIHETGTFTNTQMITTLQNDQKEKEEKKTKCKHNEIHLFRHIIIN